MGNEKSRQSRTSATCKPNETCVICQEDVGDNVSRPESCPEHFFHHDCLMKWAEHKNTCPLDNKVFKCVVDHKGKKVDLPKRKPSEDEQSSEFLRRMLLILSMLDRRPTDCTLCGNNSPDLERATLPTCGHRFHRSCLVKLSRFSRQCPLESCGDDFTEIICEFGEKIVLSNLQEDFSCSLCERFDIEIECVTADGCTHRNHRECMKKRCDDGERTCPQCSAPVLFLRCDLGERVVVDPNEQCDFQCQICDEEDRTKEKTVSTTCGHVFHRECVLSIFRTAETCPVEGCDEQLTNLKCHFGDEFGHTGSRAQLANPLHQMLSEIICDNDFVCNVCNERRPDWERAKLPCDCEFHKQCIVTLARRNRNRKCPSCQIPFNSVRCMFGEQMNFPNNEPQEEEVEMKAKETEKSSATATAGSSITCSLCQSDVEPGTGSRSSACAHPYHRVCLENIKEVEGSCLVCNKDVTLVVGEEEAGATACPESPQPPVVEPTPAPSVISTEAQNQVPNQSGVCCSCHKVVEEDQKVHPDQCDHLYHLSCLLNEVFNDHNCYVCNRPMQGVVVIEDDDELTGENCIICKEALRESQKHHTPCCRQWLHRKCLEMHLAIIRECPACEHEMPE